MPNINPLNKVDFPTKSTALQVCDTVLTFPRIALGYEDITYKKVENAKDDKAQYQVSQAVRVNNAFVRVLCALATLVLIVPTLIALAVKACLMKGQNEEIQKIEKVGTEKILNQSNASSSNSASSTDSTKKPQNASSTTSATAAKKVDSSKKDGAKLVGIDAQLDLFQKLDTALKSQDLELIIRSIKAFGEDPNLNFMQELFEEEFGKDFATLRANFAKDKTDMLDTFRSKLNLDDILRNFPRMKTYATLLLDNSAPEKRIIETFSALSQESQKHISKRLDFFASQSKQGSQQVSPDSALVSLANEILQKGMVLVEPKDKPSPSNANNAKAAAAPASPMPRSPVSAPSASVDNKARSTATPVSANQGSASSASTMPWLPSDPFTPMADPKERVLRYYRVSSRKSNQNPVSREMLVQELEELFKNPISRKMIIADFRKLQKWSESSTEDGILLFLRGDGGQGLFKWWSVSLNHYVDEPGDELKQFLREIDKKRAVSAASSSSTPLNRPVSAAFSSSTPLDEW